MNIRFLILALSAISGCLLGSAPLHAQQLRFKATTTQVGKENVLLILNNCDDSDRDGVVDNLDDKVNGRHDWLQLEPIAVVGGPAKGAVTLKLERTAQHPRVARIFKLTLRDREDQPLAAVPILGPRGLGFQDDYTLTDDDLAEAAAGKLMLYAEGLDFAVSARLVLSQPELNHQDVLYLRTAPLLLLPHTQAPLKNMVVHQQGSLVSSKYVKTFEAHCNTAKVAFQAIPNHDVWIEDELQWGYSETPRRGMHVALHMGRNRPLAGNVRGLAAPDFGYYPLIQFATVYGSLYFGGNFEVTPPSPKHPFGRVYYGNRKSPQGTLHGAQFAGRTMNKEYVEFFRRQQVQEPIELWTDWLGVGHVDEYVSFVPANTPRGYVMLLASPKLGKTLLETELNGTLNIREREMHPNYRFFGIWQLDDFFNERKLQYVDYLDLGLVNYNTLIHANLFGVDFDGHPNKSWHPGSVKQIMMEALELSPADVIEVPVLFANLLPRDQQGKPYRPAKKVWQGIALTPGMVNLSSMGKYCMIPEPFFDAFKKEFETRLKVIGQEPLWIDDWAIYHVMDGEVHCGSNMVRAPFEKKWWKMQ